MSEYDRYFLASALGVDPETLPTSIRQLSGHEVRPFVPLDDEEWALIEPALPRLPVPKPGTDFGTRAFLNSVIWHWTTKARGWQRLPIEFGPPSSREHRFRRWVMLGYWSDIALRLEAQSELSRDRLREFRSIADDAEKRKALILKRRCRLTDV